MQHTLAFTMVCHTGLDTGQFLVILLILGGLGMRMICNIHYSDIYPLELGATPILVVLLML